MKKMLWFKRY